METSRKIEPLYYSRKEVSIITGISVAALSQMAKRGVGPRCLIPSGFSCSLYPIADTHAWLDDEGNVGSNSSNRGGARTNLKLKSPGRPTKKDQIENRKRVNALTQSV